jgi:rhamnosyltransferase
MTDGPHVPSAAGIVAYEPDAMLIGGLIASLIRHVDLLLIYRNSRVPPFVCELAREYRDRLVSLGDESNLGLGVAHNRIVEAAMASGIERIFLFDQDSMASGELVGQLLDRMQSLIRRGARPAVVGPRPICYDGTGYKAPHSPGLGGVSSGGNNVPVEFVISSGSLINGAAFREIGAFREDFFIDAIDIEWCLRARSKGFTCWMATDVTMKHRLGSGVLRIPVADVRIVRQPPARAYTFVRNQLILFRLKHVPWRWKVRTLVRLAAYTITQSVCASHRRAAVRSLAHGWWDGLRGRLGPP